MGDITKNLSRHEFACRCGCGYDTVDYLLPLILQELVDDFQSRYPDKIIKIHLNSATRCKWHNVAVGGKDETAGKPMSGSMHLYARGVDFYLYDKLTGKQISDNEVADYLEEKYPNAFGIGRYVGRTHLDTRSNGPARWDKR